MLYYIILYILYYVIFYCLVSYHIILYFIVLYHIILYFIFIWNTTLCYQTVHRAHKESNTGCRNMAFLTLFGRPTVAVSVRYVIHSGTAVETWQEIGVLLARIPVCSCHAASNNGQWSRPGRSAWTQKKTARRPRLLHTLRQHVESHAKKVLTVYCLIQHLDANF